MDNILIIRLSSLGDIIHTLPAFAALRKGYPAARITWVVEKTGKEILDLVPGIDRIVVRGEKGWIRAIRDGSETAIDFQGLLKSAVITRLSGARTRIGFSGKNLREPAASVFYTERLEPFPEDGHVIDKNLRLLSKVGIEAGGYEFPIVLPESLRQSVGEILAGLGRNPGQKLVLCNVGAAWESKRWAAAKWIELIERIRSTGFFHLLLWGNAAEKETAQRISAKTGTPLAPFFSIREVLAVIKESQLVISGDTFALQAAAALDVPVLGIFGPTNPRRNGSFRDRDKIARFPMECGPCYKRECATARCMDAVVPADAAALALEMLKEENG